MRRISWLTVATAAACLASAAPAAASGEIKDGCGPGTVDGPYVVEPGLPWLDLCDSDVSGFAASGPLRGVRATLKLAGDASARPGSTKYAFYFATKRCSVSVLYGDLGVGTDGAAARVGGYCDSTTEPCPVVEGCWMTTVGPEFSVDLPASAAQVSGNTVTLSLDPNTLGSVRKLREDMASGVIYSVAAATWISNGTSAESSPGEIADLS